MGKSGFGGCATGVAMQLPADVVGDPAGVRVVTGGIDVTVGASRFRQGPINVTGQVL